MKYKLTEETKEWCGRTLHRIEAVVSFGNVTAGEEGGWIEKEENLSQEGLCWVYNDAWVSGNARVCDDAWVSGNARITSEDDWIYIKGLGRENRGTTVCRTENGIIVACGCFRGNLDEFAAKVIATHADSKYAREYLSFIETVKIHFGLEDKKEDI